jgi:P-type Ca2+ transporter type 2C
MPSNPSVIPLHTAVRGRARFKIEGLLHCQALKIELETTFSRQADIRSASASTVTGNLLVHFSDHLNWKRVSSMVANFISNQAFKNPGVSNPGPPGQQNEHRPDVLEKESQLPATPVSAADMPWYRKDRIDVLKLLDCDRRAGLTGSLVLERLRSWGPNTISELKGRSVLRMLMDHISSAPLLLLSAQGAVAATTGSLIEAALVLVVGGKGLAVVVTTGVNTEYGKMLTLTTETFQSQTPLIEQLRNLSRKLLLAAAASFALQLLPFFVPGLRRLLKIAPLTPADLAIAGANAVLAMVVNNRLNHRR